MPTIGFAPYNSLLGITNQQSSSQQKASGMGMAAYMQAMSQSYVDFRTESESNFSTNPTLLLTEEE